MLIGHFFFFILLCLVLLPNSGAGNIMVYRNCTNEHVKVTMAVEKLLVHVIRCIFRV